MFNTYIFEILYRLLMQHTRLLERLHCQLPAIHSSSTPVRLQHGGATMATTEGLAQHPILSLAYVLLPVLANAVRVERSGSRRTHKPVSPVRSNGLRISTNPREEAQAIADLCSGEFCRLRIEARLPNKDWAGHMDLFVLLHASWRSPGWTHSN